MKMTLHRGSLRPRQTIACFRDNPVGQYYRITPSPQFPPNRIGPLVELIGGIYQSKPAIGIKEDDVTRHGLFLDGRRGNDPRWWQGP